MPSTTRGDQTCPLHRERLQHRSRRRVRLGPVSAQALSETRHHHRLVRFKAWVQIDPDTYTYTVPEELKDCTGLKTVISVVTLHDTQKKMVEAFAKKRGLKLLIESEGISDERSSWMDIDEESAEYEAYCNGEYEEEEEYF
jgi:hypothetical protein